MKNTTTSTDYQKIVDISRRTKILSGVSSLLDWDQETFMPPAAAGIRAEQNALLAGLIHQEKTGKPFSTALSKLINLKTGKVTAKGLSGPQTAALNRWRRDYFKATALPEEFVCDFAKLTSEATVAWRSAKTNNDFKTFAPYLERIVWMNRKKADLVGYKDHPYDALLDDYEPDITTKEVSALFEKLQGSLETLLKKIVQSKKVDDSFLFGKFDEDKQLDLAKQILEAMGYDFTKGRLDVSSHPFSSSCHPTDSRITTRIHPSSVMSNLSVALHEGGHSLYEMGLPVELYGTPLCEAISLGLHESQSRWWEILVGQSDPFCKYLLSLLKKTFKGNFEKIKAPDFYRAVNKVVPSLIRVDADEVTYNLHVIIRFELECDLIEGSLAVKDLPDAWNAKMKNYLGITPPNNREGCLQDIHWAMGAFGYFPTYTIGNLYAAQLFSGFEATHPQWKKKVENGDLLFIKEWLNKHVHQHGRRYTSKELIKNVTGKAFSEKPFVDYLNSKYSQIYTL